MIRLISFLFIVLTGVLATGCTKKSEMPVKLQLTYNDWTSGPGYKMKLEGELFDSRCPNNELILCVWRGVASGTASLDLGGSIHAIPYNIDGLCDTATDTCGTVVDTLGYHFRFISLDPYPDGVAPPPPLSDYILTVQVEKI